MDFSRLPFLTADIPPLGGEIKRCEDDFFVEEVPLYEPCGEGTHVYVQIEKKGIATMEAVSQIARAMGKQKKDIGYAGHKDARAVARQWLSVEHCDPEKLRWLDLPKLKVLQVTRHTNKLKIGHLARNRFVIRLRDFLVPIAYATQGVEQIVDMLAQKGVPNYFGEQRFGVRGESHELGLALAKGRVEEFVDLFLGRPQADEIDTFSKARALYDQGDYQQAYDTWPYAYAEQRRALKTLIARKGNKKQAYHVVDKRLKGLFVSAFQSYLFNQVLAARMPAIDTILLGDMAYKHANGACFMVEDAALEQPRCETWEISPTGPLLGSHMARLTGPAGDIESAVLVPTDLDADDFKQMDHYGGRGGRRPLRFKLHDPRVGCGQDDLGPYVELAVELDSGCYATSLIREICKR